MTHSTVQMKQLSVSPTHQKTRIDFPFAVHILFLQSSMQPTYPSLLHSNEGKKKRKCKKRFDKHKQRHGTSQPSGTFAHAHQICSQSWTLGNYFRQSGGHKKPNGPWNSPIFFCERGQRCDLRPSTNDLFYDHACTIWIPETESRWVAEHSCAWS